MPNKKAAMKAYRQTKKRTVKNNRVKTHIKALTHQVADMVKGGKKDEALVLARKLQQAVAKAAKEHIIHKNKASNKTAAVYKKIASLK
ncbi:MAG: 30S ribosomal protein S20 [bacterium]|nr:30S ribosomal protein S20 [bacterium]